jgi:hypothetical protein
MGRTQIVAGLSLLLAGCGGSGRIVVGSKNFTEQVILGEIVAQHLERRLGARWIASSIWGHAAGSSGLAAGQIDLYPEYTGTALTAVLKLPISRDAAAVEKVACARNTVRDGISNGCHRSGFNKYIRHGDRQWFRDIEPGRGRKPGWKLGVGYEFLRGRMVCPACSTPITCH